MIRQDPEALQAINSALDIHAKLSTKLHELASAGIDIGKCYYSQAYDLLAKLSNALTQYGACISDTPIQNAQIVSAIVANNCVVIKMPLPKRRTGYDTTYVFRDDLRNAMMTEICPQLQNGIPLRETNALTFVYAPAKESVRRQYYDHDNNYIKPVIDTICAALGIDDSGKELSLCHYLASDSQDLSPWMYAIVSPGPDCLSRSAALNLCRTPELHKNT